MSVISIIIPVYKVERYISQCAHSLFGQTYSDIEYIFVNDCTPDNSIKILLEVLENYPDRSEQVKILNHEYNRGIAAVRQSGLDAAKGEYIIMVDSDDWIEIDMIAKMSEKAIREDADIVIADFYKEYAGKQIYVKQHPPMPDDGKGCVRNYFKGDLHGSSGNKLIRRCLYVDNGIHYFEGVNMWEDLISSVQLSFFAKKIAYLPKAFYHYRKSNIHSYTALTDEKSLQNMIFAISFFEQFLRTNNCYPLFKESLLYLKLTVRLNLLIHNKGALQKKFNILYPESNRVIIKHYNISIPWRISLFFASLRMLSLFNIMAEIAKKIKN